MSSPHQQPLVSPCSSLPVRKIGSQTSLDEFLTSDTCARFYAFIQALGEACKGHTIREMSTGASPVVPSAACPVPPSLTRLPIT